MWDDLTSDNLHLSEPIIGSSAEVAIGCKSLPEDVREYVRAAISENTRRAYRSDIRHFEAWGGAIPSTPEQVAQYLVDYASSLTIATLKRRIASLSVAHEARGAAANPVRTKVVRAALRGIQRTHGRPQRQAKPLMVEDLFAIMAQLGESPKDLRDRALLLIGFAGGFRRAELVSINCNDVEFVRRGAVATIPRSKTDQEGRGRRVAIPYGRMRWCPVLALQAWRDGGDIREGPVFRPVNRHGTISHTRLSSEAVSLILKQRVAAIGCDPDEFSGHSLRAGLATSAAAAGVSSWKIRQQTGHASDAMLSRYVRDGELFVNNASGALL